MCLLHIRLQLFTITPIFVYYNYTCRRVKWGGHGMKHWLPFLNNTNPIKIPENPVNKRALGWNLLPPKVYFLLLLFDWTKSWMCFSFEKQNFTLTTFFEITIKWTQWSFTLSPSHSYFSLGSFAVHFLRHNNWLKQIIQLLLIVPLVPKSSYFVQAFISLNNLCRHVTCVFTIVLEYHT